MLLRGVNIEGWLDGPLLPPSERPLFFGPADAATVARLGFDHVRINVNEQHLWDDAGHPIREAFDRVDELLDACAELGLKAVFDLHVLRCHFFNVARRTGLPLYCGEWGCYDAAPRADRLRWYADMVSILAEHHVGWAAYAYRGRWAAVRNTTGLDEPLLAILLA